MNDEMIWTGTLIRGEGSLRIQHGDHAPISLDDCRFLAGHLPDGFTMSYSENAPARPMSVVRRLDGQPVSPEAAEAVVAVLNAAHRVTWKVSLNHDRRFLMVRRQDGLLISTTQAERVGRTAAPGFHMLARPTGPVSVLNLDPTGDGWADEASRDALAARLNDTGRRPSRFAVELSCGTIRVARLDGGPMGRRDAAALARLIERKLTGWSTSYVIPTVNHKAGCGTALSECTGHLVVSDRVRMMTADDVARLAAALLGETVIGSSSTAAWCSPTDETDARHLRAVPDALANTPEQDAEDEDAARRLFDRDGLGRRLDEAGQQIAALTARLDAFEAERRDADPRRKPEETASRAFDAVLDALLDAAQYEAMGVVREARKRFTP